MVSGELHLIKFVGVHRVCVASSGSECLISSLMASILLMLLAKGRTRLRKADFCSIFRGLCGRVVNGPSPAEVRGFSFGYLVEPAHFPVQVVATKVVKSVISI